MKILITISIFVYFLCVFESFSLNFYKTSIDIMSMFFTYNEKIVAKKKVGQF